MVERHTTVIPGAVMTYSMVGPIEDSDFIDNKLVRRCESGEVIYYPPEISTYVVARVPFVYIDMIQVDEVHRCKGIGSELIDDLKYQWRGVPILVIARTLDESGDLTRLVEFYKYLGFVSIYKALMVCPNGTQDG